MLAAVWRLLQDASDQPEKDYGACSRLADLLVKHVVKDEAGPVVLPPSMLAEIEKAT